MSGKKYFVLMENGEDTSQVFVNSQPQRGRSQGGQKRAHKHRFERKGHK